MGKKSFFSIALIIIGVIAAGFISYFSVKETKRNKQIEQEVEALRQEAEKLRQDNRGMQEKILYFETPEFQEKIAKEKLNLQKEDEKVAIIKPSPVLRNSNPVEESSISQEADVPEIPNYIKWWHKFFKY